MVEPLPVMNTDLNCPLSISRCFSAASSGRLATRGLQKGAHAAGGMAQLSTQKLRAATQYGTLQLQLHLSAYS